MNKKQHITQIFNITLGGVQMGEPYVHLQPSFSKLRYGFEELVQNFELKSVGGAPNGYQLAPPHHTIK